MTSRKEDGGRGLAEDASASSWLEGSPRGEAMHYAPSTSDLRTCLSQAVFMSVCSVCFCHQGSYSLLLSSFAPLPEWFLLEPEMKLVVGGGEHVSWWGKENEAGWFLNKTNLDWRPATSTAPGSGWVFISPSSIVHTSTRRNPTQTFWEVYRGQTKQNTCHRPQKFLVRILLDHFLLQTCYTLIVPDLHNKTHWPILFLSKAKNSWPLAVCL